MLTHRIFVGLALAIVTAFPAGAGATSGGGLSGNAPTGTVTSPQQRILVHFDLTVDPSSLLFDITNVTNTYTEDLSGITYKCEFDSATGIAWVEAGSPSGRIDRVPYAPLIDGTYRVEVSGLKTNGQLVEPLSWTFDVRLEVP